MNTKTLTFLFLYSGFIRNKTIFLLPKKKTSFVSHLSILFPSEPIKSSHGKVKLQQRDDLSKKKKKMNLEKNGEKSSKKMYRTKGFNHFFFQIGRLMQKKRRRKHVWPKDRAATLGIVRIEKESSRTRASDLHTQDEGRRTKTKPPPPTPYLFA